MGRDDVSFKRLLWLGDAFGQIENEIPLRTRSGRSITSLMSFSGIVASSLAIGGWPVVLTARWSFSS